MIEGDAIFYCHDLKRKRSREGKRRGAKDVEESQTIEEYFKKEERFLWKKHYS
ncbi:hypothetical protein TKV_c03190 [Thermoanaerobacter kivui]|uniref:Uncharacterized protein n=1 Tax=Thermoanaerobacter kivui TaxID=2325 RepID=A0A097ANW3_THEKI|nr:hypothetical protein TKV_c03190 [Thermoanaerobacter kivui]